MNNEVIGLYHSDIFIPKEVIEQCYDLQRCLIDVKYSNHLLNQSNDLENIKHNLDVNKIKECVLNLKNNVVNPFEVELSLINNRVVISKFCVRVEYSKEKDISIVISPRYDKVSKRFVAFIKTAWLNYKEDNHTTLNVENYCYQFELEDNQRLFSYKRGR